MQQESQKSAKIIDQGEPSLFEKSTPGARTVTLGASEVPSADPANLIPANLLADGAPPLPEMAELCLVRHFTRLAHRAFSIDTNFYPLGSCTMKYNPRLN